MRRHVCPAMLLMCWMAVPILMATPCRGRARSAHRLSAGTGFFIRHDGTLLTAAHVVSGCQRIDVEVDGQAGINADLVASNDLADVAVLRVPVIVPSILQLMGHGVAPDAALHVFGDPDGRAPLLARPALINMRVRPGRPADTRYILWLQDRRIGHGWSGGPVLNAAGQVVGMVVAILPHARQTLPVLNHPERGVAMASGAGAIYEVLRRAGVPADPDAVEPASPRAVARVVCWRQELPIHPDAQ